MTYPGQNDSFKFTVYQIGTNLQCANTHFILLCLVNNNIGSSLPRIPFRKGTKAKATKKAHVGNMFYLD